MKVLYLLLITIAVCYSKVKYDGFKVYRIIPQNDKQLEDLVNLQKFNGGYNFWTEPVGIGKRVDVMVPPYLQANFKKDMNFNNYKYETVIRNVQKNIDLEMRRGKSLRFGWTDYHTLTEIYNWLQQLETDFPGIVKVVKGGRTYEGRDMLGVHVSFKPDNKNRTVFIEGGIHAREWISPATVTYILNQLLRSTDESIHKIATNYDWYFFPSFNPDGYVYTFEEDRLWRKTRSPQGICRGVDPNRNWGKYWNQGGASENPCDETYAGPEAFSEIETKSMSEFIETIGKDMFAYLAFHSYSQLLLIPYGQNNEHVENFEETYALGLEAAKSLSKRYGTQYTVGNMAETIYVASGVSPDWIKDKFHTKLVYTYELRDTGDHGFILPPEQIIPTAEETLDSLVTILIKYVHN